MSITWWRDLGFGIVFGAFMMRGMFVTERAAGWVTVTGGGTTSLAVPVGLAVLVKLVEWIAVGASEELVFRGYQLRNLAEGLASKQRTPRPGLWLAAVVSSLLFGFAHLANRNATAVSTLNIVLGGMLLSLPVLMTGELAASIGLHIGWNLFEGTVYGFPVSGEEPKTRLLTIRQTGPEIWTGGSFGPEAGLVCVVWMLIAAGLLFAWFRLRGAGKAVATPVESSG
jgi:membrane protease YdiL (CAAX protease family)